MKKQISHTERVLNIWAIVLIIWSLYRVNFRTDLPVWFDEFVAKPLVFIMPVYFFISKVEKKKFFSSLGLALSASKNGLLVGGAVGVSFLLFTLFWGNIFQNELLVKGESLKAINLLYFFFLSLATSISEEILSIGFVLKRLYEESKNAFSSVFFASILFFITHLPKFFSSNNIEGSLLMRLLILDFILGICLSLIFLFRKNLWTTITIHAFYFFTMYLFV